ncbi:MAG: hypothetical protein RL307_842 [Pseudomonadota bacterium]|jgi:hypothetical protein
MNAPFQSEVGLSQAELEAVYDALAQTIDDVGPDKAPLMLTKLALLCANASGDAQWFQKQLKIASNHLD